VTLEVKPFAEEFVDAAARLLSANCAARPVGERAPAIDFVDATAARKAIVGSRGTGPAVVAVRDGELVGFLMSTMSGAPGSRHAAMSEAQHTAERSSPRDVYRALYTALSEELLANGCSTHTIALPIAETGAVSAWFELGFGVDQIKGVRSVARADLVTSRDYRIRAAEPGDIGRLLELTIELQEFHARPPVFNSAHLDVDASRRSFDRAIADDRCCVWVAEDDDRIVGMMQVEPATRYRTVATIGIAIATDTARSQGVGTEILVQVLDWTREQGYEHCGAGWTSANQISDAFWRSRGFQPTRYTLARQFT
jgi:GNAT superfamily N-acetyltransferase